LGFPFNIYTMAEAREFKFGRQLRFAKAQHKITPRGKIGHGLGLGELPKILGLAGYPLIFFATAGASNFKVSMLMGFAKAHHKIPLQRKSGRGAVL